VRTSSPRAPSGISDRSASTHRAEAGGRRPPVFFWALLALCGLLSACMGSPVARRSSALELAQSSGWQAATLHSGRFDLLALHPAPRPVEEIAVFIEGDGLAWLDVNTPSPDPTPLSPVALWMALSEPRRMAVYLGRPCQYVAERLANQCRREDWTSARFSAEIVAAMNQAIDELKHRFRANKLRLVGYSGGGAIAALVAAGRDDVAQLVTVAAVLDHPGWTRSLGLTPLAGSLNPADAWNSLRNTPQVHLTGGKDKVAGKSALVGYLERFPANRRPPVIEIGDFSHQCCWGKAWREISPL